MRSICFLLSRISSSSSSILVRCVLDLLLDLLLAWPRRASSCRRAPPRAPRVLGVLADALDLLADLLDAVELALVELLRSHLGVVLELGLALGCGSSGASLTTSRTRILPLLQLVRRSRGSPRRRPAGRAAPAALALAVLDALGDLDLALAGEQRDRAHLAQVHAHRVVGLARPARRPRPSPPPPRPPRFAGSSAPADGGLGLGGLRGLLRVDDLDAVVAEHRHQVVDLIGRHDVLGQRVVDLVVGEEALLRGPPPGGPSPPCARRWASSSTSSSTASGSTSTAAASSSACSSGSTSSCAVTGFFARRASATALPAAGFFFDSFSLAGAFSRDERAAVVDLDFLVGIGGRLQK